MSARRTASPPVVAAFLACLLLAAAGGAYETDQYTARLDTIEDSTEVLNREVNAAIERIAASWKAGVSPGRFATAFYRELGGRHWVDKLERWAMRSPEVDKLEQPRDTSIYGGIPFWSTRIVFVAGLGKTLRINDILVGTDKIGHFISQGWKYHRRHRRGLSEEAVLRLGPRNEAGVFGSLFTGIYSNADLVANYEGYLFFRSLFEDDVVAGKPAILRWEGERPVIQRRFDWADHVNEYWDEALNPSRYRGRLARYVYENLEARCDDFATNPEAFIPHTGAELAKRYAHLGMRRAVDFRLDHVCAGDRLSSTH